MRYHQLGRTGLHVSAICLGTMTWGGKGFWEVIGKLDDGSAVDQLRLAIEAGVNFIDTANIYHEGLSEEILGRALKELAVPRDEVVIATKVRGRTGKGPNAVGLSRAHIMAQAEASLRRMQLDFIDLYQIHGFDPLTPVDETLRALDDLVHQGKVRYLGVSNHAAWQIMKALGISQQHAWARFESVQAYYTIAGRDLEREVVPLCLDQQLSVLVWSPLAGGLLSGKFSRDAGGPQQARRSQFDFPPVDRERAFACVDAMRPIAEAHGCSVARVAQAWLLHQPAVTSIIVGARTEEQLKDNLAAVELELSPEELQALAEVSALPPEYPGWMLAWQGRDRSGE
ncbi:MAG: aldo/keto reductase [Myxococcales bacterium]|nr:aldo/keto reductase [Myxococcales bacterium]MCB9716496.1 aldo/keto reductase [Myxococcales bacterium]